MPFYKVLVGYDGSEGSRKALEKAVELVRLTGGELHIVGVVRPFEFTAIDYIPPEEIEEYEREELSREEKFLQEAKKLAEEKGIKAFTKVMEGEPAEELMAYADENGCDLIAVGHRGAGGLRRIILGTTAGSLVKYASQSVLVVK